MDGLVGVLLVWIAVQMGCELPEPPQVRQVSPTVLVQLAYGPAAPQGASVVALYERNSRTVNLSTAWRADSVKDRSTLVHELVHHVQEATGMQYPCLAARETLAYHLQAKWLLEEQGIANPYALMGVDEFTIRIRSLCNESE